MSLENLLRMKVAAKDKDNNPVEVSPDFRVAVQGRRDGGIHFLIHADGHNSDTLDFVVTGNALECLN